MITHKERRPAWQFAILVTIAFTILPLNTPTLITTTNAQTTKATILGRIIDERGNAVARAKVIAKNLDTGIPREATADQEGRFRISELPLGKYEVQVEQQGFRLVVQRGVELTVGREAVIDFTLNVGDVTEQVVVEEDASQVERTTSAVGYLVNRRQVEDLPLNGRDVLQLATLQNGVVSASAISDTQENVGPGLTRLVVNGARLDANTYYLDGTDTADAFGNSPGGLGGGFLGVDALREFQVLTSSYSAEFGVSGGAIINAITKSGGNQIHGTAFEFLRNSSLDARNFFNAQKLPFKRNQFGGSLGGPLVNDRAFFFANYEGLRRREGTSNIFFVPSPDARQGNLTSGPVTIAPSVLPYLALYPRPNGAVSGDTGVFRRDVNESANEDFFTARLDHTLSARHSLFGRYTLDDSDLRNAAGVIVDRTLTNQNHYVTLEGQSVLSPRAINTLRASYSRNKFSSAFPFTTQVGPELSFVPGQLMGGFFLQGLSELRPALATPISFALNNIEVSEQFIYNRDAHAFKFGGMARRYQLNADQALIPAGGLFVYGGGVRAFLTGSPQLLFVPAPGTDFYRGARQTLFGFYAQDDWRISPNLTLNLGLRYEPITSPTEVNGKVSNLRNVTDASPTVGEFIANPSLRSFAPRFGFALDPTGNGLWVVRGGIGIFNSSLRPQQYIFPFSNQPPFGRLLALPAFGCFPNCFSTFINSPLPLPGALFAAQFDAEQPQVYQWNLTVQREVGKDMVVSAAYVGSRGLHLLSNLNTNVRTDFQVVAGQRFYPALLDAQGRPDMQAIQRARLNPNFGALRLRAFTGDSYYHGLQLSATRRYSAGLQFQLSYTYSKSVDVGSAGEAIYTNGPTGAEFQDPFSPAVDRGLSDFDLRHNFVTNFLWELPFGKGRKFGAGLDGVAEKLIGGWGVGGILNVRSGFPFTVTLGFDRARNGIDNVQTQRPNIAPGVDLDDAITGDPTRFVDPSFFQLQPAGFYGNLSRNALRGPDLRSLDMSLTKKTAITEGLRSEFRVETFNLFNRANFAPPDAVNRIIFTGVDPTGAPVLNPSFGRLTRTATSSRQIQFGLKLLW